MSYGGMEPNVPTSARGIFKSHCTMIDSIIAHKDAMRATFGPEADKVENSYRIVKEHIERAIRDENIQAKGHEVRTVREVLEIFTNRAVFQPMVPLFRDLWHFYGPILRNWNNNCIKGAEISNMIEYLDRLMNMWLTTSEAISVLRALTAEATKVLKYAPPSFKLSEAYLKILQEKTENVINS